tara:strand:+ start:1151 stop:1609 length:459 start_codon:yes stop_codon:yes gene_type:complete
MTPTVKRAFQFHPTDILAFIIAAIIFGPLIWWVTDRTPPVILEGYELSPSSVAPGETIYRVIKVNRLRLCETDPDTVLIDGAKVRWHFEEPPILSPGPLGRDSYKRPVVIPLQANPGPAEIRTSANYTCNALHKYWPIKIVGKPLEFQIIAK